jgi:16S rRNA (cytosine967-C5)-methyltransferase
VELIKSGVERLSLTNIITAVNDARVTNADFPAFDKILCDVPCSGLGVIGSKPEKKYTVLSEISGLPEIQYGILSTAARYLKRGGELVYSTCTLSRKENDLVIDRFLSAEPDFEGMGFLETLGEPFGDRKASIFPRHFNSHGFFIAKIRRKH